MLQQHLQHVKCGGRENYLLIFTKKKGNNKIFIDNLSAIAMAKNCVCHWILKHIDIWHLLIRDLIVERVIELKSCSIEEQVANILKQALPQVKHNYFMFCVLPWRMWYWIKGECWEFIQKNSLSYKLLLFTVNLN